MTKYNFSDVVKAEDASITLSREFILNKVSEESIFEHYGVPIKKGLFCSKLRQDNNPTVALYRNKNGRLLMKDFGSDFCGDCFTYVSELFKVSYYSALKIVANDFGLIKMPKLAKNAAKIKYSGKTIEKQNEAQIRVELRDWQSYELDWWKSYGISQETLKKFKVFSCKNIWLNENLFHLESPQQRVFGYYGGIKEGIERWKIYFPGGKKRYKFISNWKSSYLQGGKQLPKEGGEYLVITKAMKDCMVLYELGIPSVAPSSENCFVTDAQYKKLSEKFKNILVLYDNDVAGIKGLKRIRKKYPDIKVAFIPRNYKVKDISDFYKKYGKTATLRLIDEAKKHYFNVKEEVRSI